MQGILANGDSIACITSGGLTERDVRQFFKAEYNVNLDPDYALVPDFENRTEIKDKFSATFKWMEQNPTPLERPRFEYYNEQGDKLATLKWLAGDRSLKNSSTDHSSIVFIDNSLPQVEQAWEQKFTAIYTDTNSDNPTNGTEYIK
ncbi:hypothetical protein AVI51_11630 [Piscirickettsia salmonis]|uniref:Uncharacterized protein n=1 Tax=Piscirickettsia salmonis TaxID=1238 RepID=A0A9Q5V9A8_PISSA|nr:hypothetical protein [Piscirickettsia salmonis]ALA26337.1 tetratricopeptide repeat family protein [Piscirickettsia salmonis]APS43766.1 hypothetical protein AVI48_04860 [Piscirickettsia salmonis]APS47121.1 hypothetical protein AVI49_05465 [Piscirickettsia salmonis]APS51437.1 hypothetical protein AVI50_11750 [Piscirickettsia salmonis]APS54648.1 hypothetical protein AVI51_11630 [Piscirickettsia salmonis]